MSPASFSHVDPRAPRSQSCSSIASSNSKRNSGGEGQSASGWGNHHQQPDALPPASPSKRRHRARIQRAHVAVGLYSAVSLSVVVLLLYLSFFAARMDGDAGLADPRPEFLSCRSWGFGTSCGLWGVDCRPFETEWSAFRCPSRCSLGTSRQVLRWPRGSN